MEPILEIDDLRLSFVHAAGRTEALGGARLSVWPERTLALVGESGAGKSLLALSTMNLLPRASRREAGRILFRDPKTGGAPLDLARLKPNGPEMRRLRGGRIGMVFQEPMSALAPTRSIGAQIAESYRLHRSRDRAEARKAAEAMLERVGFADPVRAFSQYPFELSGGLRQRALIAAALIARPALLIADEPTSALDVCVQARILDLLRSLQGEMGLSILLITHDLAAAAQIADDMAVLHKGRVIESGPARDLYAAPAHPHLRALFRAARLPARSGASPAAEPLLRVEGLCKRFVSRRDKSARREIRALRDVSFEIRRGECLGLMGESGSGKSTLARVLTRLVAPDAGRVRLAGRGAEEEDVLSLSGGALKTYRRRVQMVFQDPYSSLNPRMRAFDIVAEPLRVHGLAKGQEMARRVADLFLRVGLDAALANRYPHAFSGGQRQRIGIARALALEPELLICDEPVSALDMLARAGILSLLSALNRDLGLSLLLIAHDLAALEALADRIAVLAEGRIVEIGDAADIIRAPRHPATQALNAATPRLERQDRIPRAPLLPAEAS